MPKRNRNRSGDEKRRRANIRAFNMANSYAVSQPHFDQDGIEYRSTTMPGNDTPLPCSLRLLIVRLIFVYDRRNPYSLCTTAPNDGKTTRSAVRVNFRLARAVVKKPVEGKTAKRAKMLLPRSNRPDIAA